MTIITDIQKKDAFDATTATQDEIQAEIDRLSSKSYPTRSSEGTDAREADKALIDQYNQILTTRKMIDSNNVGNAINSTSDTSTQTVVNPDGTTSAVPITGTIEQPVTATDPLTTYLQGQTTDPQLPAGTNITYTPLDKSADQLMTGEGTQIQGATAGVTGATASVQAPATEVGTVTYAPSTVGQAGTMTSAQGTVSDQAIINPEDVVKGQLSAGAIVDPNAVQGQMADKAYIINQLNTLLGGMEGGQLPLWAEPAVAFAEAQLNARGVGKSNVARDTLFNAIIQAAMPIAQGDAETARVEWLTNMDAKNRAIMFNASVTANMDMQNASAAQQAQIQNAQAFLQMDFMNLSNEQRSREINFQAQQQVMLSDQAAENAARQFNATSVNQTNQFMTSLQASIAQANADRLTATSQFNAGQSNAMSQFNAQLDFNRQTFNAQNALIIEQSNVDWRRRMNEIDTAGINAANQADAMNKFNLSNQALTMLWQAQRDAATWTWQSSENALDRANRLAIAALGNEDANKMIDRQIWTDIGLTAIGITQIWQAGNSSEDT